MSIQFLKKSPETNSVKRKHVLVYTGHFTVYIHLSVACHFLKISSQYLVMLKKAFEK